MMLPENEDKLNYVAVIIPSFQRQCFDMTIDMVENPIKAECRPLSEMFIVYLAYQVKEIY